MPRLAGEQVQIDADQLGGSKPATFGRCAEHDIGIRRPAQPGIVGDFLLKLSGAPACIAERDNGIFGAFPARDRGEDVA